VVSICIFIHTSTSLKRKQVLQARSNEDSKVPVVEGARGRESTLKFCESLRGILILQITLYHAMYGKPDSWYYSIDLLGGTAVSFLFSMSGFVLCKQYGSSAWTEASCRSFEVKRFASLVPLFGFSVLVHLLDTSNNMHELLSQAGPFILLIVVCLMYVSGLAFQSGMLQRSFAFVIFVYIAYNTGDYWFVGNLVFLYGTVPFALPRARSVNDHARSITLLVGVQLAYFAVPCALSGRWLNNWHLAGDALYAIRIPEFFIGMHAWRICEAMLSKKEGHVSLANYQWVALFLKISLIFSLLVIQLTPNFLQTGPLSWSTWSSLDAVGMCLGPPVDAFLLCTCFFAEKEDSLGGRMLQFGPLQSLGRASYAIYLVNLPVHHWLLLLFGAEHISSKSSQVVFFLGVFFQVATGLLVDHMFKPVNSSVLRALHDGK